MEQYSKVYKELYEIFRYIPKDFMKKIPKDFLETINEKKDNNYEFRVEHITDFHNQDMLKETRAILAVLYRNYWKKEENTIQIKEKINYKEDLFKKTKKEEVEKSVDTSIVVYKESFIKKLFKLIFRKK